MKIKKGDQIIVISGKDKGKKGKVLAVLPSENKILVEGVNIKKKHQRPKKEGEKGQIIEKPAPIYVSNVKFICPSCRQSVRLGSKIVYGNSGDASGKGQTHRKYRICKKCSH